MNRFAAALAGLALCACQRAPLGSVGQAAVLPESSACSATGNSKEVAPPSLKYTLADRWQEGWSASPAVVDLDRDGHPELVVPRNDLLLVWSVSEGSAPREVWRAQLPGRIWSSPVVADLLPSRAGLEVAVASRDQIAVYDATGHLLPGFPYKWRDELRSLAAGDIDGDGELELVAQTSSPLQANGQRDIVLALNADGSVVGGFPPNTSGAGGCDATCYVTGGYDQNLALGDVTGDARPEIFATQDNAYLSLHDGSGRVFASSSLFKRGTKFPSIRWLLDYPLSQQGVPSAPQTDLQAHFTNSAPAIADLDGDGVGELIALASVQNAAQSNREQGVALFVSRADGTRPEAWASPPRFPDYLSGLWDYGANLVAITNSVAVADVDDTRPGPEIFFAGFDGRIHAVDARGKPLWAYVYTTDQTVATGGVVAGDLSGDGVPELVFTTYGPKGGDLVVLDAQGRRLHSVALGGRGAMAVPTLADADADGTLDIVVSLKDGEDKKRQALVFAVPSAGTDCLPWPTGRGNYRRDGWVPPAR